MVRMFRIGNHFINVEHISSIEFIHRSVKRPGDKDYRPEIVITMNNKESFRWEGEDACELRDYFGDSLARASHGWVEIIPILSTQDS